MPEWDERWDYIIELGRELPPLDPKFQTSENIVQGCMSTVWLDLVEQPTHDSSLPPSVTIFADSDSLIVKGLIVILLSLYQGMSPQQIIACDEKSLFKELGLDLHLSPNRRNGLFAMVQRVKQLATQLLQSQNRN